MAETPYRALLWLTLGLAACDLLFTNGFMLLRLPPSGYGVPVNQIGLAVGLLLILLAGRGAQGLTATLPFALLYPLWMLSVGQLALGIRAHGPWAIRDAANVIETGFFVIGYCLAADPRFRAPFLRWMRFVFTFAAFYLLLYPVQERLWPFSPLIGSMSGYTIPLFFNFGDAASLSVTTICFLALTRHLPAALRLGLAGLLAMSLVVFVQARIAYLQLAFVLLLFAAFAPRELRGLGALALVATTLTALFLLSGVELPGRLGRTFTLDFLLSHIQAIWGGGGASTREAAGGVDLRLGWWREIQARLARDAHTWFLGLGYGAPLTGFRGPSDDLVREPHNSYVSVYGRLGFLGLVLFLGFLASVLHAAIRLAGQTRRTGDRDLHVAAVTMLCLFGTHLIYALGEGGFEMSFIAVPFYLFAGIATALARRPQPSREISAIAAAGLRGLPPPIT